MAAPFVLRILEPPRYGFEKHGRLYVPSRAELWSEFFYRINVFRDRRNWLPLLSWSIPVVLEVPAMLVGLAYSMVFLPSTATVYLHRYCTHRAFTFAHPLWRFIMRNLAIKIIMEEIYVLSHHTHHQMPEKPGDPYNVHGGALYCFLADVNHQLIARGLSQPEYDRAVRLLAHTGVRANTYEQYRRWGSICHPARTIAHLALNWSFWWVTFAWIGGQSLAIAVFGLSTIWAWGIRTWNYGGHGGGKDLRRDGVDFNRADLSVNDTWSGWVAGEWHNNHHLYPNSARAGFLPHQPDPAWYIIRGFYALGGVSSYRDAKDEFLREIKPFSKSRS